MAQPTPSTAGPAAAPSSLSSLLDLAVSLTLHSWPALTLAVTHSLGGPDSAEKRDYLGATLAELLLADGATMDEEDVEEVLLQYLADEFEIALEDGSEVDVAVRMVRWRGRLLAGDAEAVQQLEEGYRQWREKGAQKVVVHRGHDGDDDEDDSSSEEEDGDDSMDVDGAEAPPLARSRPEPEVDEDGFTKVVGKKRR